MSYAVIGDIHGENKQLQKLLCLDIYLKNKTIIFLGDYIDIGSNPKDVLDLLIEFQKENKGTIFLKGNHESYLESYIKNGDLYPYAIQGGLSTIKSFTGTVYGNVYNCFKAAFNSKYENFLSRLGDIHCTSQFIFSHCIFNGLDREIKKFREINCKTLEDINKKEIVPNKKLVYGHYFQKNYKPYQKANKICIDTGCGILGGPLTCLLLPENEYIQVEKNLSISNNTIE